MKLRTRTQPRFDARRATHWSHPNQGAHNRILYRAMEDALEYAALGWASGRLVDVGCGVKPWRGLFAAHVEEHVGVDHEAEIRGVEVDIVATAYEVPLPDEFADTLLLSAVLEHLERPADALREAYRLLAPGGYAIVTAPFLFHVHADPHDYFRYTSHGLRYLLEEAGFTVVEIVPIAGVWTTLSLEVSYALRKYRRGALRPLVEGVMRGVQWAGARWDRVDYQPQFSWSHLAVAQRPPQDPSGRPQGREAGRTAA